MTIAAKVVAIIIATSSPINGIDPLGREQICYKVEDVPLRGAGQCIANGRFYNPRAYCLMCMRDRKDYGVNASDDAP